MKRVFKESIGQYTLLMSLKSLDLFFYSIFPRDKVLILL